MRYPVEYPDCSRPETGPRAEGGIDSIVSDAPTPQMPPMAMPNNTRTQSRNAKFGENAEASSNIE